MQFYHINLVPCCKDCNTGKGSSFTNVKEEQALHPYYDDFTNEQWLFAEVLETSPLSIRFSVNAHTNWTDVSKARVEAHFIEYDLKNRFSVEATNEVAKINSSFMLYTLNKRLRKKQLKKEFLNLKKLHLNSWESALYQALAESDWYCREGYTQGVI